MRKGELRQCHYNHLCGPAGTAQSKKRSSRPATGRRVSNRDGRDAVRAGANQVRTINSEVLPNGHVASTEGTNRVIKWLGGTSKPRRTYAPAFGPARLLGDANR